MQDMMKISEMFQTLGLSEMTVKDGDFEIFLKKTEPGKIPSPETGNPEQASAASSQPSGNPGNMREADKTMEGTPVTAPLPGIFYQGDSEEAEPYVKVGDSVAPETVVCSIEAMKMLNYVKAGTAGKVKKICASQGDMVGFGQTLLVIEKE